MEELARDDGQKAGAGGTDDDPRGEEILYATPQELLDKWEQDREGLLRRIEQVLLSQHARLSTRSSAAALKPRIQLGPFNPAVDPLSGELGFACLVLPPTESYTKNTGDYSLKPVGKPVMAKSIEGCLVAVRMRVKGNEGKDAPTLPGTFYRFMLEKPAVNFLVAASKQPYVLMLMPDPEAQVPDAQVAVPEVTTAMDVAETPTDAPPPPTLGTASEATPERPESPDQVTGLIERLSLPGAASNSVAGTGASKGGGGALGRALALKTEGNLHFSSGDYSRALPLYSEAIEVLEGAGDDAALATILCNRSVAYLKLGQPASALTDAERAGALGGGKAHFRRAEALSSLGRYEEAFEAYAAALENAEGAKKREVRERIAEVKRGRVEVPLHHVRHRVMAAAAAHDWPGVLKWEGRMEQLLEGRPDAECEKVVSHFLAAHAMVMHFTGAKEHALAGVRIGKRRVEILGKMERFRDQGAQMCAIGIWLSGLGHKDEAARWYQKARRVAEAHGFFSVESQACIGLGKLAIMEGRDEDGVELLQNALAAAGLSEDEGTFPESHALSALIDALFKTNNLDEAEKMVVRFREVATADSRKLGLCSEELNSHLHSARLHEARGRPQEATREVRALLHHLRENRAPLQDVFGGKNVLRAASQLLNILDPVRGEKELVRLVAIELELARG